MNADLPRYPTVEFLQRHGAILSLIVALLPPGCALVAVLLFEQHWLFVAAGAIAGALVYLVFRSYLELIRLIFDVLMPR